MLSWEYGFVWFSNLMFWQSWSISGDEIWEWSRQKVRYWIFRDRCDTWQHNEELTGTGNRHESLHTALHFWDDANFLWTGKSYDVLTKRSPSEGMCRSCKSELGLTQFFWNRSHWSSTASVGTKFVWCVTLWCLWNLKKLKREQLEMAL